MKTLAMDWKMSETFTAVRINVPNEITLLIIIQPSSSGTECGIINFSLMDMDVYVHLLLTNRAVAPCDSSFKTFVMQEFL